MITNREAEEILKKEYHIDNFLYVVNELLLPDFEEDRHEVEFNNDLFASVTELGQSDKCDVTVYEVILKEHTQNRRVAITQQMFKILRGQAVNNAVVAFANADCRNYRFSLLTSKYELDGDKVVKVLSNPRRYSYSLGYGTKTKTAYDFLIGKGKVNSLDELINRFSVEVVNKQFYNEIALAFTKLVGGQRDGKSYEKELNLYGVTDPNKYAEFAVRLIGRIVFCWFLKEKKSEAGIPLIPENMITAQGVAGGNYYHDVLEPLFFELLNTNQNRRKGKFAREEAYTQIPYLNGGLFSPHADDHYKFSHELQSGEYGLVTIPNEWFLNFYNILGQYNFTVDENTSYDIELSIDPEMLGRIFENLLAEINPETGENAKKSTGSFYTPRDIVDYMVDSSILEHLKTKTNIDETKLRALISYGKEDDELAIFSMPEKKALINALYTVTVLDPACGSGAFPIGMLQKIVYMLQEIDPEANLWFDKATENVSFLIKKEFEKKFNAGSLDYIRKLTVIQNSIFGVDIQPIAVEIARLRCFLSLVIEEKVYDNEPNRGINALPNLDFKFIIANTLLTLPHERDYNKNVQEGQLSLFERQDHISQLKSVRDEYFSTNDIESKNELKLAFSEIQKAMFQEALDNRKMASARYQALFQWAPFNNQLTEWFDPEWMFGVKDGFDIVIGNPPYFLYQASHKGEIEKLRKMTELSSAFGGKLNAYKLFLAKALHSLTKRNGLVCYIFQNSFLADKQASELRKDVFNNYQIIKIDSFPERDNAKKRVFETVKMSVCVALFSKSNTNKPFIVNIWDDKNKSSGTQTVYTKGDIYAIDRESLSIPRLKQELLPLIVKINNVKNVFHMKCYEGELNMTVHKPFFTKDTTNPKVLKGASIQRYFWTEKMSQGEIEYIDEERYLSQFKKSAKAFHHRHERIAMQGMTGANDKIRIVSTVVPEGVYLANSCNYILAERACIEFLLGVFNSKLINWYFRCFSTNSNVNGYEVDNLPISLPSMEVQNGIVDLVNQILTIKANDNTANTVAIENRIDKLVYQMYELTDEEIAVIEATIK